LFRYHGKHIISFSLCCIIISFYCYSIYICMFSLLIKFWIIDNVCLM
jgi:hypothetical protein